VQVKIASVHDLLLGDLSRQIGGVPVTLAKAAVPYSGGRAVSLFTHKKYDTLTLEYVDAEGGLHGAIFELKKGQATAHESASTRSKSPDHGFVNLAADSQVSVSTQWAQRPYMSAVL
jgi:hypothetical protein